MNTIRETVISIIDSGITSNGLYRTLNHDQINMAKNFNWYENQQQLIYVKYNVVVMNYNNNLYAISLDNNSYYAFYQIY